jgi:transcriptional regulator with XRE-family HTH domain
MKKEGSFKSFVQSKLKAAGKTQKELADRLGASESALSHLLSRGTSDPDIMKIIAQFLNFDVSLFNSNSQIKSHLTSGQEVEKSHIEQLEHMKELLKMKDELIKSKDETIAALRQSLNQQQP